ncbi:hypothetical protein [Acidianus brierleyi]|uniref:Uncharacterized protein n=1 Tax=Acidianus brierleyi TaxID=41673 RepID=A0A2U9IDA4_9CREN|nr:hypothetical protein [Acidianus brierleyi]AWR93969.1 hypothetical protein DFR85_04375 [Acidianus brierleyi]
MQSKLVDIEDFYYSDNPYDVLKFYTKFNSAEELVKWMKTRPRAPISFHEIEGDTDVIVVIPTADVNNKYAKGDLEMYNGLHIIFCESSGKYFNYATSVNTCVKEAMKYNPEWIIFSNDDVYKIDEPSVLKKELGKFDYKDPNTILPVGKNYKFVKSEIRVLKPTIIKGYRNCLLGGLSLLKGKFSGRYPKNFDISLIWFLARAQIYYNSLLRKFNLPFLDLRVASTDTISYKARYLMERALGEYINNFYIKKFGDFGGFSRGYLNKFGTNIFDETFINGVENYDLSLQLLWKKIPVNIINYRKGSYKGRSLGLGLNNKGVSRTIRSFSNFIYMAYKNLDNLVKKDAIDSL